MLDLDTSACFFSGEVRKYCTVGKVAAVNILVRWEVKV